MPKFYSVFSNPSDIFNEALELSQWSAPLFFHNSSAHGLLSPVDIYSAWDCWSFCVTVCKISLSLHSSPKSHLTGMRWYFSVVSLVTSDTEDLLKTPVGHLYVSNHVLCPFRWWVISFLAICLIFSCGLYTNSLSDTWFSVTSSHSVAWLFTLSDSSLVCAWAFYFDIISYFYFVSYAFESHLQIHSLTL